MSGDADGTSGAAANAHCERIAIDGAVLDRALWRARPRASPLESAAGLTCSVGAHLALAGMFVVLATLFPASEPPGFVEIPIEVVVGTAAPWATETAEPHAQRAGAVASDLPSEQADATTKVEEPGDDKAASQAQEAPAATRLATDLEMPPLMQERVAAAPRPTVTSATAGPEPSGAVSAIASGQQRAEAPARGKQRERPRTTNLLPRAERRREPVRSSPPPALRRAEPQLAQPMGQKDRKSASAKGRHGAQHSAYTRHGGGLANAASPESASTYRSRVIAHLTRFKRYPTGAEARGAEGNPAVSFSLDGVGRVLAVSLARSSGHSDIDAETLAMVRRATPFPPRPLGAPHAFSATVSFQLR